MTAFNDLMAFQRETSALGQIAGRLGWDQETVMPRGAAAQRAEEMAAIEAVLHARRSDPRGWVGWPIGWSKRPPRTRWARRNCVKSAAHMTEQSKCQPIWQRQLRV